MNTEIAERPVTPLTLIEAALAKGIDADQLSRLLDLQERFERSRGVEMFNVAMAAAQRKMPAVLCDSKNTHTNSTYASFKGLNAAIQPIYTEYGFSIGFGEYVRGVPESSGLADRHIRVYIDVMHSGGHCKRTVGDFPLDDAWIKGTTNKTPMQAVGSSKTYAKRYLLKDAFAIAESSEDNDGNAQQALVTPEQVGEINGLLEELSTMGRPVDLARFKAWLKVESLDQLLASHFTDAIRELNRKRREAKGGAA
jgi:hypothetical protein